QKGIQKYVKEFANEDIDYLSNRMMREINQSEDAKLIPNIAKYILENNEYIFRTWFTEILPFDKSRFWVSDAKTGSRTDFVVRLQYTFRNYELKILMNALRDSTELLIRSKSENKLMKIKKDKNLSPEKKKEKIVKVLARLEKNLEPDKLAQKQKENAQGAQMVARFLLINSEKAFNLVLNKIIRYHYKRLRITTPVSYITNVLESGAWEKGKNLKAFYVIHSREW
ncbi:MAG: hypothetical protein ACTSVL_12800, partial [Promethearchaeota archaeon]